MSETINNQPCLLSAARLRLQARDKDPFLAVVSLYLDLVEKPREWFEQRAPWSEPTAATDGKTLYWYRPFVESLSPDDRAYLVAHESMHVISEHHLRLGGRDPEIANIAADYRLNIDLEEAGWKIPEISSARGWTPKADAFEEIYAKLQSKCKLPKGAGVGGASGCGNVIEPRDSNGNELSADAKEALAKEWKTRALQAAQIAKEAGNLPGSYERFLQGIVEPRLPWHERLRRYFRDAANKRGDDYAWFPLNRRMRAHGLALPAIERTGMGTVAVLMDLSGSIGDDIALDFVGRVRAIRDDLQPRRTLVLYFDTRVAHVDDLSESDYFGLENVARVQAGGGTDLDAGFAWLRTSGIKPEIAVVLTDLYGSFGPAPNFPTIWCAIPNASRETPPFGELVRMN